MTCKNISLRQTRAWKWEENGLLLQIRKQWRESTKMVDFESLSPCTTIQWCALLRIRQTMYPATEENVIRAQVIPLIRTDTAGMRTLSMGMRISLTFRI